MSDLGWSAQRAGVTRCCPRARGRGECRRRGPGPGARVSGVAGACRAYVGGPGPTYRRPSCRVTRPPTGVTRPAGRAHPTGGRARGPGRRPSSSGGPSAVGPTGGRRRAGPPWPGPRGRASSRAVVGVGGAPAGAGVRLGPGVWAVGPGGPATGVVVSCDGRSGPWASCGPVGRRGPSHGRYGRETGAVAVTRDGPGVGPGPSWSSWARGPAPYRAPVSSHAARPGGRRRP